jgi:acyl-CoA reductase-like NAD-dependent aldehyde dehydrogenase
MVGVNTTTSFSVLKGKRPATGPKVSSEARSMSLVMPVRTVGSHGPVIHERAANKAHEHVQDATSRGAKTELEVLDLLDKAFGKFLIHALLDVDAIGANAASTLP